MTKVYRDRFREKRVASGMCIHCGKEPRRETSKLGQNCHERCIENRKRLKDKRVKEGKCSCCLTRLAIEGRKLCKICVEKKRVIGEKKILKTCLTHKISLDDYFFMLKQQNGRCKICGQLPGGRWDKLSIDHCHRTGKVRGLLCHNCNTGLGNFKENTLSLYGAIKYLEN